MFAATEDPKLARLLDRVEALEREVDALAARAARPPAAAEPDDGGDRRRALAENAVPAGAADDDEEGSGVTVAARHFVRPEKRHEFRRWCDAMAAAMRGFAPGFRGSDVFHAPGDAAHVVLFRFSGLDEMERWLASDARGERLVELRDLVDRPSEYAPLGGRLRLVADPGESNLLGDLLRAEGPGSGPPPALHKATVLTILGLFLVAWPVDAHLGPALRAAPLPAAVLGATAPCVVLNTYFGAPLMFFFFRGWLHGAAAADGPVARVLAAGLPGRARKAGVLAANFAVLLAVAFAK